jgi:hypothetical protein
VNNAALHQYLVTEDLAHTLGQGFRAVQDEQQPAGGVQATLDQIA